MLLQSASTSDALSHGHPARTLPGMPGEYLTTAEAAEQLGIDASGVRRLILDGRLPAQKFGSAWMIRVADLALVKDRPVGYPKGKPRAK